MSEPVSPTPPNSSQGRSRLHRLGSLCVFFAIMGLIYASVAFTDLSQDVKNPIGYGLVLVAIGGLSIWIMRGRLPLLARLGLAAGPWVVFYAMVQGWLPLELVHNGNVGLLGVRLRGYENDRQLDDVSGLIQQPSGDEDPSAWQPSETDYPRFLGNGFWAEVPDPGLDYDKLKATPPKELWRVKVGAGWSSFAVIGRRAITQEQRGDNELVTCYDLDTGNLIWAHSDHVRWDAKGTASLGYTGPRATPTVVDNRVYSHGATGILNCLELRSGKRLWSHDTIKENYAEIAFWGKSGSPLVAEGKVIVSVGASEGRSLIAYDAENGQQVWASGSAKSSYASPIYAKFADQWQIVSLDEAVVRAVSPADGKQLWRAPWASDSSGGAATSQPVPMGDDRLFLSKGYGQGASLLQISRNDDRWKATPLWKGKDGIRPVMKTKMGNVLLHDEYVYGLDEGILECIDLKAGRKRWKKRRSPPIDHGQILLVGNTILVVSESGEVIFVEANPKKYRELASFPAVEGLTWNSPTLVGNLLLVRNAEQAVCFELPIKETPQQVALIQSP